MAGTIALAPGRRWSAASWLFDWTVTFLSGNVSDPSVSASLGDIVTENLGWLALDDYGPEPESEMHGLLRTHLVADADRHLPPGMAGRVEALSLLSDLASSA